MLGLLLLAPIATQPGNLQCWGLSWPEFFDEYDDYYGIDDDQGTTDQPDDLGPVLDVGSDFTHTCALKEDKSVACWGYNNFGGLDVPEDINFKTIALSVGSPNCALLDDGTVRCWGLDEYNVITGANKFSNVTSISNTRAYGLCIIFTNSTTSCIGYNSEYDPSDLTNVRQIVKLRYALCVLFNNQTVNCWSYEYKYSNDFNNVKSSLTDVISLSRSGWESICAVHGSGKVTCWEHIENPNKILSDGAKNITNAVYVDNFDVYACAVLENKTLQCWGKDFPEGFENIKNANMVSVSGEYFDINGKYIHSPACAIVAEASPTDPPEDDSTQIDCCDQIQLGPSAYLEAELNNASSILLNNTNDIDIYQYLAKNAVTIKKVDSCLTLANQISSGEEKTFVTEICNESSSNLHNYYFFSDNTMFAVMFVGIKDGSQEMYFSFGDESTRVRGISNSTAETSCRVSTDITTGDAKLYAAEEIKCVAESDSTSELTPAEIAGIAVGSTAGLVLISGVVYKTFISTSSGSSLGQQLL